MKVSQYTLVFPLDGQFVILNSLTQALSIISKAHYDVIRQMKAGVLFQDEDEYPLVNELYEQGFLVPDSTDERVFAKSQMMLLRPMMSKQLRQEIVIIPTFSCNLTCSYCFQHVARHTRETTLLANDLASRDIMSKEMIDAAINAVEAFPEHPNRTITIFGGEPLINTARIKEAIEYICGRTRERGWDLRIYTNGVELENHVDLIRSYRPNFQVTFHDICDKAADFRESPVFCKWLSGVNAATMERVHVTIRINVSETDVEAMPNVCRRFSEMDLFDRETVTVYFTPILNKNFAEAGSNRQSMRVLSRLLELRQKHPAMQSVDFIGWKVLDYFKAMGGNRDVPVPKFVRCPAMENLLCFDTGGKIYPCYELAGIPRYAIGSYYPEIDIDRSQHALWQSRTILHESAKACAACPTSTICGGGCAADSLRREGDIHAASCEASESDLAYFVEHHPDLVRSSLSGRRLFDKTS